MTAALMSPKLYRIYMIHTNGWFRHKPDDIRKASISRRKNCLVFAQAHKLAVKTSCTSSPGHLHKVSNWYYLQLSVGPEWFKRLSIANISFLISRQHLQDIYKTTYTFSFQQMIQPAFVSTILRHLKYINIYIYINLIISVIQVFHQAAFENYNLHFAALTFSPQVALLRLIYIELDIFIGSNTMISFRFLMQAPYQIILQFCLLNIS